MALHPTSQAGEALHIVFTASESHRPSRGIDFEHFGIFSGYGTKECLKYYGPGKLILCTFAAALSRRLNPGDNMEVAVHTMCPGGVATKIARDAPLLLKPVIHPVSGLLFQTPGKAIGPAIYLCCAQTSGEAMGMCLHWMQRKSVSPTASDPENGTRLWEASEALVAKSRESP